MSVFMVMVTVNIHAVTTVVSQVSVGSSEVEESLSHVVDNVLSDDNSSIESLELSSLVRDSIVSSPLRSDGTSSSVEVEPLLDVSWEVGLDSESVLVTSDVLCNSDSSSSSHLGSDLESLVVVEWWGS